LAVPVPDYPAGRPRTFRATVHGTVFADRERHLDGLTRGDPVVLIPDPPGQEEPGVWVHLRTGEPVGHLPPEISRWLWPWLAHGGRAVGHASAVHGSEVPSWRRLVVEVDCDGPLRGEG
jgi:hypothetical protein